MSPTHTPSAWIGQRGAKWRDHLTQMESTLATIDGPLIDALALSGPLRIAEIGAGGGGTTAKISARAEAGSVIHGYDISPHLVEAAQRRLGDRATFTEADVGQIQPPAEGYDRLCARFSLMFFDAPQDAFARLRRWLKPEGRFAFTLWADPSENPWATLPREIVGQYVDLPPPAPDAHGPFRYSEIEELLTLLSGAGFTDLRSEVWRGNLPVGGGLDAPGVARFALSAFSAFAEQLAEAGPEIAAEAEALLTERLRPYERAGVVRMPAAAHVVTGGAEISPPQS